VKSRSRARSHLIAACLVTALAAGTAACGSDEAEHTLVGFRPSGVQQVDTVEIPDVSAAGEPFTFRAEPGQLLLVSFGYTQCPDVCPTTLAAIRGGLRLIGDQADAGGAGAGHAGAVYAGCCREAVQHIADDGRECGGGFCEFVAP
jgi:hypothetical protein